MMSCQMDRNPDAVGVMWIYLGKSDCAADGYTEETLASIEAVSEAPTKTNNSSEVTSETCDRMSCSDRITTFQFINTVFVYDCTLNLIAFR